MLGYCKHDTLDKKSDNTGLQPQILDIAQDQGNQFDCILAATWNFMSGSFLHAQILGEHLGVKTLFAATGTLSLGRTLTISTEGMPQGSVIL